jgi:tRNA (guanine-N7-)-methyltransferase
MPGNPPEPAAASEAVAHRPIRSFVLRQARMSEGQRRALETLTAQYCLPFDGVALDFAAVFRRVAPVVLEIGSGMGETTAAIAAAHPGIDFMALEVHAPGVGSLLKRIDAMALTNLRIIRHDAVEVLATMVPLRSLGGIHVYFPDPWPKKRHHKRRLLKAGFVHALAQRLAPGGYLHAATDWEHYAHEMLATFSAEPLLSNTAEGFAACPAWRPQTKFERRGLALGHRVFDVLFTLREGA